MAAKPKSKHSLWQLVKESTAWSQSNLKKISLTGELVKVDVSPAVTRQALRIKQMLF